MLKDAHRNAQPGEDAAVPLSVALGQVIVHGDEVGAPAVQRVQVEGEGGDQRFAFAGLQLRDLPLVEDDGAEYLHVEGALTQAPADRLPRDGESLREEVVQSLVLLQTIAELRGLGAKGIVAQPLDLGFEAVDLVEDGHEPLDLALVGAAEDLREKGHPNLRPPGAGTATIMPPGGWPAK